MSSRSILVVEDDSILAIELKMLVTRLGYRLAGAVDNAEDALELAQEMHPRLILMDVRLRGEIDGIELAQQMNKLGNDIVIIYLSGYSDLAEDPRLANAPFEEFFIKPLDLNKLQAAIQDVMAREL